MNPLKALGDLGQSVWLDFIKRSLLTSGELARLVAEDGVRGLTSNPAIFEKAIAESAEYDAQIRELSAEGGRDALGVFEALAIRDIRAAADALRPVYDASDARDG